MVLKERRRVLIDGLRACRHGRLEIEDSQAGMHFVAWLAGRSDAAAAALIEPAPPARPGPYPTPPPPPRPHPPLGLVLGSRRLSGAALAPALVVFPRLPHPVFPLPRPPPPPPP